jgi:hypothetical protein
MEQMLPDYALWIGLLGHDQDCVSDLVHGRFRGDVLAHVFVRLDGLNHDLNGTLTFWFKKRYGLIRYVSTLNCFLFLLTAVRRPRLTRKITWSILSAIFTPTVSQRHLCSGFRRVRPRPPLRHRGLKTAHELAGMSRHAVIRINAV